MFEKVLIANRGEVALRINRACHEMGIKTVAVHSTADKDAMHVRLADEAVCIGGAQSKDSYLNKTAIKNVRKIRPFSRLTRVPLGCKADCFVQPTVSCFLKLAPRLVQLCRFVLGNRGEVTEHFGAFIVVPKIWLMKPTVTITVKAIRFILIIYNVQSVSVKQMSLLGFSDLVGIKILFHIASPLSFPLRLYHTPNGKENGRSACDILHTKQFLIKCQESLVDCEKIVLLPLDEILYDNIKFTAVR